MVKKVCNQCGRFAWHNQRKDVKNPPRCTFCGFPVVAGSPMAGHNNLIMQRQSAQRLG